MATPLPAYAVQTDVHYNNNPVNCLELENGGSPVVHYVLMWDELHESDKNVIVNDVVPNNGGTLPHASGLAGIADYVLPNGMTFISVYGFAIKDLSLGKPVVRNNVNNVNEIYFDGTVWRRLADDAVVA